jgi:hypothetical protein
MRNYVLDHSKGSGNKYLPWKTKGDVSQRLIAPYRTRLSQTQDIGFTVWATLLCNSQFVYAFIYLFAYSTMASAVQAKQR